MSANCQKLIASMRMERNAEREREIAREWMRKQVKDKEESDCFFFTDIHIRIVITIRIKSNTWFIETHCYRVYAQRTDDTTTTPNNTSCIGIETHTYMWTGKLYHKKIRLHDGDTVWSCQPWWFPSHSLFLCVTFYGRTQPRVRPIKSRISQAKILRAKFR